MLLSAHKQSESTPNAWKNRGWKWIGTRGTVLLKKGKK